MECPRCNAKLAIVRTISAGSAGKVQEAFCDWCKARFTLVTTIMQDAKGYGNGAQAVASRLRRDKDSK